MEKLILNRSFHLCTESSEETATAIPDFPQKITWGSLPNKGKWVPKAPELGFSAKVPVHKVHLIGDVYR